MFGNKKSSTLNTPEKSSTNSVCPSANAKTNPVNSSQTHSQSLKPSTNSTSTTTNVTSTSSNKTLDLIASKFFNLKSTSNKNSAKTINATQTFEEQKQKVELSLATSSSSSSLANFNADSIDSFSDNTSLKTNHSFNNLVGVSSIQVPSSVLIFENRPRYAFFLIVMPVNSKVLEFIFIFQITF